jgi:hypothetical protein
MKNNLSFVFLLALACIISACQPAPDVESLLPQPGEKSMKGYELYSWQENGEWVFSLLIGTNRVKGIEEIQAEAARLGGVNELQTILESLPAGEYLTWQATQALPLPPEDIVAQVKEICARQGLELSLAP